MKNLTILGISCVMLLVVAGGLYAWKSTTTVTGDVMMEKPEPVSETKMMMEKPESMPESKSIMQTQYVQYSQDTYTAAAETKRVLFFHASWCPTCKVAREDFTSNMSLIPEGVTVLQVDYDTEKDLKEKYGITYQHTFVQVDAQGSEVTKWNGGGTKELAKNIK